MFADVYAALNDVTPRATVIPRAYSFNMGKISIPDGTFSRNVSYIRGKSNRMTKFMKNSK